MTRRWRRNSLGAGRSASAEVRQTVRHASTMLAGATFAQFLPVVLSPVLTRLYSPQEFGLFALFLAVIIPLTLVAAGRYDMAVMAADSAEDARDLVIICVVISCVVVAVAMAASGAIAFGLWGSLSTWRMSLLISGGIATLFGCWFSAWQYWLVRAGEHKNASVALCVRGLIMLALQVLSGVAHLGASGLILPYALAPLVTMTVMSRRRRLHAAFTRSRGMSAWHRRSLLIKYKEFPLFTAPASLINNVTMSVVTWFVGHLYGANILGQYSLVQRSLGLPTVMAGQSIGQILYRDASKEFGSTGTAWSSAKRVAGILVLTSIPLFTIAYLIAPWAFPVVFGDGWKKAGVIAQIMMPMFAIRFIASPLSLSNQATRNNKFGLVANAVFLLLTLTICAVAIGSRATMSSSLWALTVAQSVFYVVFVVETLRRTRRVNSAAGRRVE